MEVIDLTQLDDKEPPPPPPRQRRARDARAPPTPSEAGAEAMAYLVRLFASGSEWLRVGLDSARGFHARPAAAEAKALEVQ